MDIKPRRQGSRPATQTPRPAPQTGRSVDGMTAPTAPHTATAPAMSQSVAPQPAQGAVPAATSPQTTPVLPQGAQASIHHAAPPSIASPSPQTAASSSKPSQSYADATLQSTPQSTKKKRRFGRWLAIGAAVLLAAIIAAAAGAWFWYRQQLTPVQAGSQEAVQIVVSQGATVADTTAQLANKGLIKNALAVQLYHRFEASAPLKAGVYTFTKGQSPADMLAIMAKGESSEARITFKPGETVMDARKVLQEAGYKDSDIDQAFAATYDKYPMMKGRPAGASVEGFILGETYSYTKQFTVQNVLDRPFALLQQLIEKEKLEEAFAKQGLSLYQGIVLASIIQKEVSKPEDMALVSSVFHNRLKKNMQLGSDVTAAYGVQVQGRKTSVVEAVSIDTPYNTRMHTGLPPTPIASPGLRALRAAANPAQSDYLYFVAGDDGKTYFATTNEEHERNTKAHCDKLCKL